MEILVSMQGSSYPAIENMQALISNAQIATKIITEKYPNKKIFLTGIGSSGVMIITAMKMQNNDFLFIMLNKNNENNHRFNVHVEDYFDSNSIAIIVDDFVQTGATLKNISEKLKEHDDGRSNKILRNTKVIIAGGISQDKAEWLEEYYPSVELIITS